MNTVLLANNIYHLPFTNDSAFGMLNSIARTRMVNNNGRLNVLWYNCLLFEHWTREESLIYVVELFSTVQLTMQLTIARNGMSLLHIWIFPNDNFPNEQNWKGITKFHSSHPKNSKQSGETFKMIIIIIMNLCLRPKYGLHYYKTMKIMSSKVFSTSGSNGIWLFIEAISTERKNWRDLFSSYLRQKRFLE